LDNSARSLQAAENPWLNSESRNGLLCHNDPINKSDPFGLEFYPTEIEVPTIVEASDRFGRTNSSAIYKLDAFGSGDKWRKQTRMRRVGPQQSERLRATQARQVWSWDFVEDQTENGTRFRILTLLDEHTRQCLATHAAWSIRAVDAITALCEGSELTCESDLNREDRLIRTGACVCGARLDESSMDRDRPHGKRQLRFQPADRFQK
jgi:hypothetical protein